MIGDAQRSQKLKRGELRGRRAPGGSGAGAQGNG